jgi:hypothetical protein
MKKKDDNKKQHGQESAGENRDNLKGYPLYPVSEDIYSQNQEEENIDPEDVSKVKESPEEDNPGTGNEDDSNIDIYGGDLDIPGSELDDEQENVGNEDEENNYYSIGDDDHDDLEEDKGE